MLKNLLLFFIALSFFTSAYPQSIKNIEYDATEYFEAEEYSDALKYYLKLDSLQPDNAKTKYRIGVCYMNSQTKINALPYFEKAKELQSKERDLDLYLGRVYHLRHQFDEAEQYYNTYKGLVKDSAKIVEKVNRYIEMCKVGRELIADSSKLVIENLGPVINSPYPDYVPAISADETVMIFTSRRPNTTGGKQDPSDGLYFEDLYISHKDANGNWGIPENMGEHINTKLHEACIGLSPDGQKLFIYRATPGKTNSGDIYVSNLKGNEWSVPVKMSNAINSSGWEPSATITSDEKTIYFSSDRPGGQGGTDLYYSKLEDNGQWGKAVNMGPGINTPYDDDAPYIHPDSKTLYFSSKGHRTMGGFDIFTTVYNAEKNEWSAPVNAGYPINTADDDIFFVWSADGTKGYFSSWRHDTYGDKDLYVIHGPKKGTSNLTVLKGKILNAKTKEAVGATITLIDTETNKPIGIYNSNSLTAKYTIVMPHGKNYEIKVEAAGYLPFSQAFDMAQHSPFFEVSKEILLEPMKVDSNVVAINKVEKVETTTTTPKNTEEASIVLKDIFFDHNKSTLRNESTAELQKLYGFLKDNGKMKVEISGHTDSDGNDDYNLRLSNARAKAVVNYLSAKGIKNTRMTAKGYGESKPIASNDTEDGKQMNRRTELKIIK